MMQARGKSTPQYLHRSYWFRSGLHQLGQINKSELVLDLLRKQILEPIGDKVEVNRGHYVDLKIYSNAAENESLGKHLKLRSYSGFIWFDQTSDQNLKADRSIYSWTF